MNLGEDTGRADDRGDRGIGPDLTRAVVHAIRGCAALLDGDHRIIAASAPFCRNFDTAPDAAAGQVIFELGGGAWDVPALRRMLDIAASEGPTPEACAFDLSQHRGETRRLVGHAERLAEHPDQARVRVLLTLNDVSEPPGSAGQRREPHAVESLLLKEARHRISNGLQIVAGVLLQTAREVDGDAARGHLQAAYGRVMAIAALERQLADTSDNAVGLQGYLSDLCLNMSAASIGDPSRVSLRTVVDAVEVSANTAASLGMIVTELVVNSLKHAFPGQRPGDVTVTYDAQGADWVLSVSDNGVGMPEGAAHGGLGTEIVSALARQLSATVEVADAFPGKVTSIRYVDAAGAPDASR